VLFLLFSVFTSCINQSMIIASFQLNILDYCCFTSLYSSLFTFLQTFNNTTNHHHYYYYYIILVSNTTLCSEPSGYDVPLLTILKLSLFIIWGYISCTWLIVSHDIVLALSRNWTFYFLVVFLSSYWDSWRWW